jgi:hypothetical protein
LARRGNDGSLGNCVWHVQTVARARFSPYGVELIPVLRADTTAHRTIRSIIVPGKAPGLR